MSEREHNPEPWRVEEVLDEQWVSVVCGPATGDGRISVEVASLCRPDDARRIVAAVNACAGIPTEALEGGAVKKALATLEDAYSLADLIPTLVNAINGYPFPNDVTRRAMELVRRIGGGAGA